MDINLKPCPFCGGEAELKRYQHIPQGTDKQMTIEEVMMDEQPED